MSKELIQFTPEDKKVIMDTYFPVGTSREEMSFCMSVAKNLGLNPILKEIFFVERQSQVEGKWVKRVEPLVGRDSFLKLAHSSGKFTGIDTSYQITKVPILVDGKWQLIEDLVATCKVFRRDCDNPFTVSVLYNEYVQTKKDGSPNKFWKEKPVTMLQKVAESQCLRKAFNIVGVYIAEEVDPIYVNGGKYLKEKQEDLNKILHDAETDEVIEDEIKV